MKAVINLLLGEVSETNQKKMTWDELTFIGIVLSVLAYFLIRIDIAFYNYLAG